MKKQFWKLTIICLLLVIAKDQLVLANGDSTQINRYSTVKNEATPAQINPLLAVAQFKFQPNVQTIGDAINQVLQNTSYSLVPVKQLPAIAQETLKKPLPITVRTLGPLSVKDAVLVLIGKEVFTLIIDPAHRLINFRVNPNIVSALGAHHEYYK